MKQTNLRRSNNTTGAPPPASPPAPGGARTGAAISFTWWQKSPGTLAARASGAPGAGKPHGGSDNARTRATRLRCSEEETGPGCYIRHALWGRCIRRSPGLRVGKKPVFAFVPAERAGSRSASVLLSGSGIGREFRVLPEPGWGGVRRRRAGAATGAYSLHRVGLYVPGYAGLWRCPGRRLSGLRRSEAWPARRTAGGQTPKRMARMYSFVHGGRWRAGSHGGR